jgi:hypothetical protein
MKEKELGGLYTDVSTAQWPVSIPHEGKIAGGLYTTISPAQWPVSTPLEGKITGGPLYSYFTCTLAH